jgi:hypothetical protein
MSRILVAIVAAGIAFGSTAAFAADAAKSTELTREEKADMRSRAEQLTAERARLAAQPNTAVGNTHKATEPRTAKRTTKSVATKSSGTKTGVAKSGATKPGKGTTPAVKKGEPKV